MEVNHGAPDPDERVRLLTADMLETGRAFIDSYPSRRYPTPSPVGQHSHGSTPISVVAAAAVDRVLVVALVTVGRLHTRASTATKQGTTPAGWVAYSAYGLQVAVPRPWFVLPIITCPANSKPGSLTFGEADLRIKCFYPQGSWLLFVRPRPPINVSGVLPRTIVVNGVHVEVIQKNDSATTWYVPSKRVLLRGTGTNYESVLHTLRIATSGAVPLPGQLQGSVQTPSGDGLRPITSQILRYSMVTHGHQGKPRTIQTDDGEYTAFLSPGVYHFTASGGDAVCPAATVKVVSGLTTTAPTIVCQEKGRHETVKGVPLPITGTSPPP